MGSGDDDEMNAEAIARAWLSKRVRAGIAARVEAGEHGRRSPLSDAQIVAARAEYDGRPDEPVRVIAARYGVSRPALYAAFLRMDPGFTPGRRPGGSK